MIRPESCIADGEATAAFYATSFSCSPLRNIFNVKSLQFGNDAIVSLRFVVSASRTHVNELIIKRVATLIVAIYIHQHLKSLAVETMKHFGELRAGRNLFLMLYFRIASDDL